MICSGCCKKFSKLHNEIPSALQPADPRQPTIDDLRAAAKYLAMPKSPIPPCGFDSDDDSVYLFKV